MTIHSLVKSRHELAKKFTQPFIDETKKNLKDYKAEDGWLTSFADNNKLYVNVMKRYEVIIPMIFTNTEGSLASMFDRVPDLIFSQGGLKDGEKIKKIKASYEYLKYKCNLEEFMNTAAWWYILTGFVSASAGYNKKSKQVPATGDDGQPLLDSNGKEIMVNVYEEDDPELNVSDPEHIFFSPESEYSIDALKIPYYTKEKLMTTYDVERTYGQVVEPDASLKDIKSNQSSTAKSVVDDDLDRVKIIQYYGHLHPEIEEELSDDYKEDFDLDGWFYIVTTKEKILHLERVPEDLRTCKTLKWYGVKNEFFGFGLGKLLRPFQKEKSLRRTQQARYADVAAFPKLLVPTGTDIDESAATDPREIPTLMFDGDAPSYLSPPDMSNTLQMGEQKADQDAQAASGMLDMSQGSQQSSTVDTATGQAIFAEASEKRIRNAKRNFMMFYKECVIVLLKLAKMYWDEAKIISITDDDGNEEEVSVTAQDLSDIDFDKDIRIDPDSLTINKDVIRAQAIELYDRVKDDPLINRKEVFKDMMRIGFDKKNPDQYMKDMLVEPGTKLVNPETGEAYTIDETGEIVLDQAQEETAPSEGGEVPMDQAGIMGGSQQL